MNPFESLALAGTDGCTQVICDQVLVFGRLAAGCLIAIRDGAVWGLVRSVLSARIGMYCVVWTLGRSTSDLTCLVSQRSNGVVEVVLVIRVVSDFRAAPSRS